MWDASTASQVATNGHTERAQPATARGQLPQPSSRKNIVCHLCMSLRPLQPAGHSHAGISNLIGSGAVQRRSGVVYMLQKTSTRAVGGRAGKGWRRAGVGAGRGRVAGQRRRPGRATGGRLGRAPCEANEACGDGRQRSERGPSENRGGGRRVGAPDGALPPRRSSPK